MRKLTLTLLTLTVLIAGCRANSEPKSPEETNISMELSIAPDPPQVGEATLVVSLQDADGAPINDAKIDIRGDMNHAGMQPVIRELSEGENGDYVIPFEWSMGGDWYIVVTATLANGIVIEQQFDYSVSGEMDMDGMDSMDMGNDAIGEGGSSPEAMDMGADAQDMGTGTGSTSSTATGSDSDESSTEEPGMDDMDMGNDEMDMSESE